MKECMIIWAKNFGPNILRTMGKYVAEKIEMYIKI